MKNVFPLMSRLALVLAVCAVLPCFVSCKALTKKYPIERTVDADSERILWEALRTAIYKSKHPVGGTDPGSRQISTGWRLDLAPFKGDGYRTRVHASYVPSTGERKGITSKEPVAGLESFDVVIRIEKETNESLSPLNLDRAKWTAADDDERAARELMQLFHSLLGTAEFELEEPDRLFGID